MTQIENELSGPSNTPYVEWLGELAVELKTGLPWIMCHGAHANGTIETCNGCDCTAWVDGPISRGEPVANNSKPFLDIIMPNSALIFTTHDRLCGPKMSNGLIVSRR